MTRFSSFVPCPRYSSASTHAGSTGSIRISLPATDDQNLSYPPAIYLPAYEASASPPPPSQAQPVLNDEVANYPTSATYYQNSSSGGGGKEDSLPGYTKFAERSRAERCFWYGFLLAPIWFWGFLHYWKYFSQVPPDQRTSESRMKLDVEAGPGVSEEPTVPTIHVFSTSSSDTQPPARGDCHYSADETPIAGVSSVVLESDRPGVIALWRKHEQRWALKCGYALASWWFLMVLFVVAVFMAMSRKAV